MIPLRDTAPRYHTPYVTWTLIALCSAIFLILQILPDETVRQLTYYYGMVPIRYSNPTWATHFGLPPDHYFSFISNLFLHGSWFHWLSNMLFLWIFADNVEDRMGPGRFLVFYLVCGILATGLQWFFDQAMVIPVIGASGAIAGVLGAYFLMYPFERVVIWVPILFLPLIFNVPAIGFLGVWVILQIGNATSTLVFSDTVSTMAWWAHLGGFIAGITLYRLFLKKDYP
ncbi:MAG: rhomboid family intramembrane serine protease [Methylococcales bacterium]|nr:rhomboid family intramembrane serine protease [Methylococcales bacterium]